MTVLAGAAVLGEPIVAGARERGATPGPDAAAPETHRPVIKAPRSAIGSLVPVFVSVPLAMTADHYVRALEIAVPTDPVPSKGRVSLTPACGEAYFYTQVRVDEGRAELIVTAECNRHGPFDSRVLIEVLEGG